MKVNRRFSGLFIILSIFVAFSVPAFAAGQFTEIYTTGSNGGTAPKSTFGWNETPWLYLKLPNPGLNVSSAWWQSPNSKYYFTSTEPNNNQERWLTLNNWNDVKSSGPWSIDASYFYANNPNNPIGNGKTTFVVSPEPISSILFLVGGAALIGSRKFRKKRKAFTA